MDRVHIPRSDDPAVPRGTWKLAAYEGQPIHRCPKCGKSGFMINHSVEADGTVNASIACFPPCDYHVWGILDGWTHGKKEAGKPIAQKSMDS